MKKIIAVLGLLTLLTGLYADESGLPTPQEKMSSLGLSNSQIATLMSGQKLEDLSVRDKTEFSLFVRRSRLAKKVAGIMNEVKPELSVECLTYHSNTEKANRTDIMNALLRLSSLSSLKYYNPSKRKTQQLVMGASTVESPNAASGKLDNVLDYCPDSYTTYLRQTDDVFGTVNYQVDYYVAQDEIVMVLTNKDSITSKGFPFPFAAKDEYRFVIHYIPLSPAKGSLVYTTLFVQKDPMTFSRESLIKLLMSYMEAYKTWFINNYPPVR